MAGPKEGLKRHSLDLDPNQVRKLSELCEWSGTSQRKVLADALENLHLIAAEVRKGGRATINRSEGQDPILLAMIEIHYK